MRGCVGFVLAAAAWLPYVHGQVPFESGGCWKYGWRGFLYSDFNDYVISPLIPNTVEACTMYCGDEGYPYAGIYQLVGRGRKSCDCHCGSAYGEFGQADDAACDYTCDDGHPCGPDDPDIAVYSLYFINGATAMPTSSPPSPPTAAPATSAPSTDAPATVAPTAAPATSAPATPGPPTAAPAIPPTPISSMPAPTLIPDSPSPATLTPPPAAIPMSATLAPATYAPAAATPLPDVEAPATLSAVAALSVIPARGASGPSPSRVSPHPAAKASPRAGKALAAEVGRGAIVMAATSLVVPAGGGGNAAILAMTSSAMLCPRPLGPGGVIEVDTTLNPFSLAYGTGPYQEYNGAVAGAAFVVSAGVALCSAFAVVVWWHVTRAAVKEELAGGAPSAASRAIDRRFVLMTARFSWLFVPFSFLYGGAALGVVTTFLYSEVSYKVVGVAVFAAFVVPLPAASFYIALKAPMWCICEPAAASPGFALLKKVMWGESEWVARRDAHGARAWHGLYHLCFDGLRPKWRCWYSGQLLVMLVLAALSAWQPMTHGGCVGRTAAMAVLLSCASVCLLFHRPFIAPYENVFEAAILVFESLMMWCIFAALLAADPSGHWGIDAAEDIGLVALYAIMTKFVLDMAVFALDEYDTFVAARGGGTAAGFLLWLFTLRGALAARPYYHHAEGDGREQSLLGKPRAPKRPRHAAGAGVVVCDEEDRSASPSLFMSEADAGSEDALGANPLVQPAAPASPPRRALSVVVPTVPYASLRSSPRSPDSARQRFATASCGPGGTVTRSVASFLSVDQDGAGPARPRARAHPRDEHASSVGSSPTTSHRARRPTLWGHDEAGRAPPHGRGRPHDRRRPDGSNRYSSEASDAFEPPLEPLFLNAPALPALA
eukprot:TRINITY_DN5809_c0_g2_i2.p1 TRINITY_DN5809_c0_g2~~TRINITY_DN5809_c0_g2_i2.p1  ORF type:complete len:888 (+),score=140.20 TRINITY_DN5809_c0_g2_i2:57-2720(+)